MLTKMNWNATQLDRVPITLRTTDSIGGILKRLGPQRLTQAAVRVIHVTADLEGRLVVPEYLAITRLVIGVCKELGTSCSILPPILDRQTRSRPEIDARQDEYFLGARDRYEKLRCRGVTPEELLFDTKHNDLLELQALAFVDRQDPHGVELGQPLERLDGITINGKFSAERIQSVFDEIVEPRALLVRR